MSLIQAAHPSTETIASLPTVIERASNYYPPITTASPDALVAEAILTPAEIQNLEEQMSDIMRLCTANNLKPTFHVRIEIADAGKLSDEKRAELDAMLQEVSKRLWLS